MQIHSLFRDVAAVALLASLTLDLAQHTQTPTHLPTQQYTAVLSSHARDSGFNFVFDLMCSSFFNSNFHIFFFLARCPPVESLYLSLSLSIPPLNGFRFNRQRHSVYVRSAVCYCNCISCKSSKFVRFFDDKHQRHGNRMGSFCLFIRHPLSSARRRPVFVFCDIV